MQPPTHLHMQRPTQLCTTCACVHKFERTYKRACSPKRTFTCSVPHSSASLCCWCSPCCCTPSPCPPCKTSPVPCAPASCLPAAAAASRSICCCCSFSNSCCWVCCCCVRPGGEASRRSSSLGSKPPSRNHCVRCSGVKETGCRTYAEQGLRGRG